ncbi:unnamed protein product [Phytomonas sp. EM1]|nr:unnamed protein product [Phytomonas sp. EM1]|eukprot:CCW62745.1 unnamed protein product [Phytomonas sp. isolate EM1]
MTKTLVKSGQESLVMSYLPEYNRSYHHSVCKAYNIIRHVVDTLRMDDTVFATAMSYWHEFVLQHGRRKIHEAVLGTAAVFLAGKVEHYKLRVDQMLKVALEVDVDKNPKGEDVEAWRRMLLDVELVLLDSLNFDCQRSHPIKQLLVLLETPNNHPASRQTKNEADMVKQLQHVAHCLYMISLISPLCVKFSYQKIAAIILYMVVYFSGNENAYAHIWKQYPLPELEERDCIIGVIMDAFIFTRKKTGLPQLDDLIVARRKRVREEDSLPMEVVRSSGFHSSSVGSESYEGSPFARPVD